MSLALLVTLVIPVPTVRRPLFFPHQLILKDLVVIEEIWVRKASLGPRVIPEREVMLVQPENAVQKANLVWLDLLVPRVKKVDKELLVPRVLVVAMV